MSNPIEDSDVDADEVSSEEMEELKDESYSEE